MKSISTINLAIMENTECSMVKMRTSIINLKVGVSLAHGVSLCFVSLLAYPVCRATCQAEKNVRSAPALTLVLHRSHNTSAANRRLCSSGERNGAQRKTKVSFSRTIMQALELLRLVT